MKKITTRAALLLLALAIALLPAMALAESETDGAGNVLASEGSAAGMTIGGDLYSIGQNVDASGAKIAESAILAGQYVSVNNGTVGGSLRAAGYQINAANTAVDVNATLAGYSVNLGQGFSAKAVYAAAQSVSFAGECDTMGISAQTVTIAGTVNGDVTINAETVNVLDTAVITGSLNVTAENEPAVAAGASVGNIDFTKSESQTSDVAATVAPMSAAALFLAKLGKLAVQLPGAVLLAVLYYFVIRNTVDDAANMVKTRPAAMPVSGFVTLISLPIAAIILLCTVIGVPVGLLLLCLYGLALAFAGSFAGAMAGKLAFPKMHTLLAYIIGAAAVAIVRIIPFAGGLVTLAAMIYTLGYFIQKIYLGFAKKESAAAAPAAETAIVETATPAAPQQETEKL